MLKCSTHTSSWQTSLATKLEPPLLPSTVVPLPSHKSPKIAKVQDHSLGLRNSSSTCSEASTMTDAVQSAKEPRRCGSSRSYHHGASENSPSLQCKLDLLNSSLEPDESLAATHAILRTSWNRKDVYNPGSGKAALRANHVPVKGPRAQCLG